MIEVRDVSKRFGDTLAVDHLSFAVKPGVVTGFLGPNGAGKSTTMRIIVGLDRPTGGTALINGRAYRDIPAPMQEVGALLDAKTVEGGRSARRHLHWLALAGGVPARRVDEVLDVVGLTSVADKRVKGFSLGMSQRLGLAAALLGDPGILLFDEPFNGLDPQGIYWMRSLLRKLATEGRSVLISSHLMSEMEETADHVIVIGKGRLIADQGIAEFTGGGSTSHVRVVSPQADQLVPLLQSAGAVITANGDGGLVAANIEAAHIGDLAAANGIRLHELSYQRASLESAFFELTDDSVEYRQAPPDRELVTAGGSTNGANHRGGI
ncbi:MAG: ATP-binding cassette domain-containing protein [Chloroflexia bacterium]|nr:ATP-binding cassette domain-containing protein [Chloroflexia bacterium]